MGKQDYESDFEFNYDLWKTSEPFPDRPKGRTS